MTTPTPTSELGPALSLPDERALSSLASALFQTPPSADSARPGPASLPRLPVSIAAAPPPGLPTQPQFNFVPVATSLPATPPFTVSQPAAASHAAPSSVITPRLVPTPAQSADLPAASSTLQPLLGAASGPTAGVPEAYGALTPATPPTPTLLDSALPASPAGQPPSTPYYFLAEANAARGLPGATAVPLPGSFALPGGGDQLTAHAPEPLTPPNALQSHAAPQFYFTDLALPRENDAKVGKPGPAAPFDVQAVRRDFPILQERINGRPLIWFDNAATTQKPQAVIDRVSYFYAHENSNIHRAAHALAARATDAYEGARRTVARFIGAASVEEVIFVRGATEGINLVAKSWGAKNIGAGDEIVVTHLEHHANIVPWQQLASENGAVLKVIPVDDRGQVILAEAQKLIGPRTKIVAITQVSNALGTVVPVAALIEMAHRAGAKALVDGAQSVSHLRVDVRGNIADAVGLGAALEYVERIGIERIAAYEHELLDYATARLRPIAGVRLVGTADDKASVLSFVLKNYSTEEVGRALNEEGIAVRSGHHCAQPILRRFGLEATVRPSFAFYNTHEEVDVFIRVIQRLSEARR